MVELKEGEPALPAQGRAPTERRSSGLAPAGMTLRDHFAAKVIQGMFAHGAAIDLGEERPGIYWAQAAYAMADAMIAERKQRV